MLIDERHGPRLPPGLTEMDAKADLYATDSYFWEGWEDFVRTAGDDATALAVAHSLVVLKPDAVASRSLSVVIDWLLERGFAIVAAEAVLIERHVIRLMWQYQWNIARRERKDACDLLLPASRSLMLVIRRPAGTTVPATHLFASLKGPADPALRRPEHLRAKLGRRSTLLNFVHSADEPADLVRELAILLTTGERRRVFAQMRDGFDAQARARALAAELYRDVPAHDLELDEALARLEAASVDDDLRAAVAALRSGASRDWRTVFERLDAAGVPCAEWDRITVGAHLITMDYDGWDVLIPGMVKK